MKIKTKVLVVGGGPAGSIAASVLAREGLEVLLLEKNPEFAKPCGGGISSVAFEKFNIPADQVQKKVDRIRLISPLNISVDVDLYPNKLFIVDRPKFDGFLRGEAAKSGAGIMQGEFKGIKCTKKYHCSTIAAGEENMEVTSEFIIAADGVNSKVRSSLGIKPQPALLTISQKINSINSEACEFWFSASHAQHFYSWVFPSVQGISVGTGSPLPGRLKQLFETFKGRLQLHDCQGEISIYRIPVWKGDLYSKGRIIFVGDAAGQVMPLSYEGIYYSMKSAEIAAEAVVKGSPGLYRKSWKSQFYRKFLIMSKLNSYFLGNDVNAEKLVHLHSNPEIQDTAKALWLLKDPKTESFKKYIRLIGKTFI